MKVETRIRQAARCCADRQGGAGKTFVALSLVCKDIEEGRLGCTVVVVPKRSSCSGNPPSKFAPNMKFTTVTDYMSASALMYGDISMLKENVVLVDSLYCDTLASVVETANIKIHRVIYDEVIEVVLRRPTSADDLDDLGQFVHDVEDSPPDARGVHLYLYANAYKIPRAILEKVECICEPAFIAAVSPYQTLSARS
jgi:hypothetical protein